MYVPGDPNGVVTPSRWSRVRGFGVVLGFQAGDVGSNLRLGPVLPKEVVYPGAGVAKQRPVDEVDGCGRSLDVQQDGAELAQLDAVRSGMYVGPMQSGW
jgi:hypothetical protein